MNYKYAKTYASEWKNKNKLYKTITKVIKLFGYVC